MSRASLLWLFTLGAAFAACSSEEEGSTPGDAAAGTGNGGSGGSSSGASGSGAGGSTGGSAGASGSAGVSGGAGVAGSAAGASGNGGSGGTSADGGQPVGSLCVNDVNCSQSGGKTVCCATPGCVAPCECQLETNCPGGTPFLPCQTSADCAKYGGGKVCCETNTGGSKMRFCTKQNGCNGQVIP